MNKQINNKLAVLNMTFNHSYNNYNKINKYNSISCYNNNNSSRSNNSNKIQIFNNDMQMLL